MGFGEPTFRKAAADEHAEIGPEDVPSGPIADFLAGTGRQTATFLEAGPSSRTRRTLSTTSF